MCIPRFKPLFLPVNIQHTPCPGWFILERHISCSAVTSDETEITHYKCTTEIQRFLANVLDTTNTTYTNQQTIYALQERRNEKKKKKN